MDVGVAETMRAMPEPDETRDEALRRLDEDLRAFDAKRVGRASRLAEAGSASEGYRLAAGVIGGVFGGLGLGWTLDRFAHTSPFGLISGVLLGLAGSIYAAIRGAATINARTAAKVKPSTTAAADDDDDDG